MKIILLREAGGAYAFRFDRVFWLSIGLLVALLLAAAVGWYRYEQTRDQPLIDAWRTKLADQRGHLDTLRDHSQSQAQTLGRQLANLQARVMRIEALGTRVVEVAKLDAEEFSFSQPAPVGGPEVGVDTPLLGTLQQSLDVLAVNLGKTERELEVLETLLQDQDYQQAKAIAGRPINSGWLSSPFGRRVDPISGQPGWHMGVDFAGKTGSDVVAVAGGVVTYAGHRSGYGELVEINHGDGFVTRYGHHASLAVELGEIVKPSQVIGYMGSSGRSTGPHVHFEVLKDGRQVDPAKYVASRREPR